MTKQWFIVDVHNQFVPREAIPKTKGTEMDLTVTGLGDRGGFRYSIDLDTKLRVMDEAGIDMVLLHQAAFNHLGLEFCRAMNDGNARLVKEYPDRFIGCAHIPLDSGGSPEALYEIDRAISGLGLHGVALGTSGERTVLGSPELYPLYEKINSLDVPVVIHPFIRFEPGHGLKHAMHQAINVEIGNTKAAVEVMFGVLNKFPNLIFLMPHHGGALPIWQGRMMNSFVPEDFKLPEAMLGQFVPKTPRIRKQLGLDKAWQAIFDKLYFDTSGFQGWMPITESTLLTVRPDRLCFGTDYGFEILEAQDIKSFIDDIKKLNLPEIAKRNILGESARTLFKLNK